MKTKLLFILALLPLVTLSCKKDESEELKGYLNGALTLDQTTFMLDKAAPYIELHPKGVYHPKGKKLGCYTYLSGVSGTNDTTYFTTKGPAYTSGAPVKREGLEPKKGFPDELATYSLFVVVYPEDDEDYYSTSTSCTVVLLDRNLSVPELSLLPSLGAVTDCCGNKYNYITVNGVDWMKSNLAADRTTTAPDVIIGHAPYDSEIAGKVFGRLYSYEEALSACPAGWSLPTDAQWKALAESVAGRSYEGEHPDFTGVAPKMMINATVNGDKMWEYWPEMGEISSDIFNSFSAIPVDRMNVAVPDSYRMVMDYACFWTADSCADDSSCAYFRYIYEREPDVKVARGDKASLGLSVRCVREH